MYANTLRAMSPDQLSELRESYAPLLAYDVAARRIELIELELQRRTVNRRLHRRSLRFPQR